MQKILAKELPELYENMISNCDARYRLHRIYCLTVGYLRSTSVKTLADYEMSPSVLCGIAAFCQRYKAVQNSSNNYYWKAKQYLIISASVFFSKNIELNLVGNLVELCSGTNLLKKYIDKKDLSQELFDEIERRINTDFDKSFYSADRREVGICANLANVPIYSATNDGEIVVSTLNSIKSTNTTAFYYFMRSISSSNDKYTHSFIPIKGIPDNQKFKNNPFKRENYAQYLYQPSAPKNQFQYSILASGALIPVSQAPKPTEPKETPTVIIPTKNIISEIRDAYQKKLNDTSRDSTKPLTIYERSEIVRMASCGDRKFLTGLAPQSNNKFISGSSFQAALSSMYALPPKQITEDRRTLNQVGESNSDAAFFCKYPTQSKKFAINYRKEEY